jgi:hypothetical protein
MSMPPVNGDRLGKQTRRHCKSCDQNDRADKNSVLHGASPFFVRIFIASFDKTSFLLLFLFWTII